LTDSRDINPSQRKAGISPQGGAQHGWLEKAKEKGRQAVEDAVVGSQLAMFGKMNGAARQKTMKDIRQRQLATEKDTRTIMGNCREAFPRAPYVMFPYEVMLATDIDLLEKLVFAVLCSYLNPERPNEKIVRPSQKNIARQLNRSERQVRRALERLERQGYLMIESNPVRGNRKFNAYVINYIDDRRIVASGEKR
jgi:hypothetical protein